MGIEVNFEGKIAMVTGASSGLGARFAKALAGAGAQVVLASRGPYCSRKLLGSVIVFIVLKNLSTSVHFFARDCNAVRYCRASIRWGNLNRVK